MEFEGSCHCGSITFSAVWPDSDQPIPARACGCDFCRLHGGIWTSNPNASLVVAVASDAAVSEYRFGTETAVFHICARCGVVPVVTSDIAGNTFAVVNVNAIGSADGPGFERSDTNFDGEDVDGRLDRRAENWIADVTFE